MKLKRKTLIPAVEHRTFLAPWEGLDGGVVGLEYERTGIDGGEGTGDPGYCVGLGGRPKQ